VELLPLSRSAYVFVSTEGFSLWCKTTSTTIDVIDSPFDEKAEVQTLALAFAVCLFKSDELGEMFGDGTSAGLLGVLAFGRRLIGLVL